MLLVTLAAVAAVLLLLAAGALLAAHDFLRLSILEPLPPRLALTDSSMI